MELQSAIQTNNQRPLQLFSSECRPKKVTVTMRGGALTWISSFLFWNDFFGPKTEFKVADSRPGVNVMHVACDSNVCDKPNTIIVA
jgi:hypothetical protein